MTGKGPIIDIGALLRDLGLEQYKVTFRENKIASDVLSKLTADDLKDLGVVPVGDRRTSHRADLS
jgi:hypothetical protein